MSDAFALPHPGMFPSRSRLLEELAESLEEHDARGFVQVEALEQLTLNVAVNGAVRAVIIHVDDPVTHVTETATIPVNAGESWPAGPGRPVRAHATESGRPLLQGIVGATPLTRTWPRGMQLFGLVLAVGMMFAAMYDAFSLSLGFTLAFAGVALFCFGNFAAAQLNEPHRLLGPAVAGVGAVASVVIAIAAALAGFAK